VNHHLWGKSERAIFAIITSLLLPIFISKLPIQQWNRGNVSYNVIFLIKQRQAAVPDRWPLIV